MNSNLLSSSFLSVNISQERNLRDSLCKSGQKGRVTKHARVIFSWTKKNEDDQKQTLRLSLEAGLDGSKAAVSKVVASEVLDNFPGMKYLH